MLTLTLDRRSNFLFRLFIIAALLLTFVNVSQHAAIASISTKLYYTGGTGDIMRTDLDGSGVTTVLPQSWPEADIEIDASAGTIYYITGYNGSTIRRVNLDGIVLGN